MKKMAIFVLALFVMASCAKPHQPVRHGPPPHHHHHKGCKHGHPEQCPEHGKRCPGHPHKHGPKKLEKHPKHHPQNCRCEMCRKHPPVKPCSCDYGNNKDHYRCDCKGHKHPQRPDRRPPEKRPILQKSNPPARDTKVDPQKPKSTSLKASENQKNKKKKSEPLKPKKY